LNDTVPIGEPTRPAAAKPAAGFLSEIFCSVQGEGPYVGRQQVFCRTAGCTLGCAWCDTQGGGVAEPEYAVYGREKTVRSNPTDAKTAAAEVLLVAQEKGPVDTVSLTGGEPLEQPEFMTEVARVLNRSGLKVYLETNGIHARALEAILPYVDILAMDIKLPSAVHTELWERHETFLSCLKRTAFVPSKKRDPVSDGIKDVFVKVVLDGRSKLDEVKQAASVVAAVSPRIPLILQPESGILLSPQGSGPNRREFRELIEMCSRAAAAVLEEVRVIPQCHKILGIR
jgi:organic radical activating enzyme